MSRLRPECSNTNKPALPDDTALFLIYESVKQRRSLIHGRLHNGHGGHCAIGAFWNDNNGAVLNSALIDEVAAVNDSVPPSVSPKERWKTVMSWLRWKKRALTTAKGAR